jgi:hypothetical protein
MAVQTTAVVRQSELKLIHDLQDEIKEREERLNDVTEAVKALLFAKAPVEPGRFAARLDFKRMHNVPWKQVVIEHLGAPFMEEVRRSTPSVTRCELVVIEHAIPPLWKKTVQSESEPEPEPELPMQ